MNLNQNLSALAFEALEELASEGIIDLNGPLAKLLNELMKIEREQVLGASPYERTEKRKGYANGFKNKMLQTRFGKLKLDVPQARGIDFYPSCLEKGERTERALKLALAEMYVNGVSTRKVKKVTEELCGTEISSTQVSRLAKIADEEIQKFRTRSLGRFKFVYLDAHYEKVRHQGYVRNLAVLKAVGINEDGIREIIGVSVSLSEAEVHWRTFLEDLVSRGINGVELIISDDHAGLKASLRAVFPSVPWQRCIFHLAQNAQHHIPNKMLRKEISSAVRSIYGAISLDEAKARQREIINKYRDRADHFCDWLEENFEEGLTFYKFPSSSWLKIRTVNVVARLNQEIRRRTRVARLFPNEESCLRLVSAVVMDIHEEWVTGKRYIILENGL